MIFQRFYNEKLAQTSYLLGCAATGEALVVDPNRDIEQYVRAADAEGLRITAVTETHIHADFVSGLRELSLRTGGRAHLSDEGDVNWKYGFASEIGARLLHHGDSFSVGRVEVRVLHTPGHTPEHLSFLVTDTATATSPMGIITGDFVFVGDVGRPDLLERAAQIKGSAEEAAGTLFQSLQRFKALPDHLQLWPGHGAGSACGKAMSAVPQSTVGYEKLFNWALSISDQGRFVASVLAGQPDPPKYFAEMKRINKSGPRVLGGWKRPPRLSSTELPKLLAHRALVVDTRPAAEFAAGHIPGTINIPLNRSFTGWAGWLLPYDRDSHLLVGRAPARERPTDPLDQAVQDLGMIGLDRIAGYFDEAALAHWRNGHGELAKVRQIEPAELAEQHSRARVAILDVRGRSEWEAGHLPGVVNIPLGYLVDQLDQIPRDKALVVHCQGGARSAIAASVLQAHGFQEVSNLIGGYEAWRRQGFTVAREDA